MPSDDTQQPPETPPEQAAKKSPFTPEQWDRIWAQVREVVAADRAWEAEHRQRPPETPDEEILSRLD
jgi:hypothetical protein